MSKRKGASNPPPSLPDNENIKDPLTPLARTERRRRTSSKISYTVNTRSNGVSQGSGKYKHQNKDSGREPSMKLRKRNLGDEPKTKKAKTDKIVSKKQAEKTTQEKETNNSASGKLPKKNNPKGKGDDSDIYEVEDILDYWVEHGKEMFLVKWLDWDEQYNTWEEKENLNNCDQILIAFFLKRVEEVKLCSRINKRNPRKLSYLLGKIPIPTDPRPMKQKINVFFESTGFIPPSHKELEEAFKKHKAEEGASDWPMPKVNTYLLNSILGKLVNEEALQLKRQLIRILALIRHEEIQLELKKWEIKINRITDGKPRITVINEVDLTGPPEDFTYINAYVAGKGVRIPDEPVIGCKCERRSSCYNSQSSCCAAQHDGVFAYSAEKRIIVPAGTPVFECNRSCTCGPSCANRVVQDGTVSLKGTHLCIFRTPNNKGWGVKTLKVIKKGSFVALYAGEIITSAEAEERGKGYDQHGMTYLFDLDLNMNEYGECMYTVDAMKMGNVSHFFNHSCDPNLTVYNVFVDCMDINIPKLALFANKDIPKDTELTFDYKYNTDPRLNPRRKVPKRISSKYVCLCAARNCRKFLF